MPSRSERNGNGNRILWSLTNFCQICRCLWAQMWWPNQRCRLLLNPDRLISGLGSPLLIPYAGFSGACMFACLLPYIRDMYYQTSFQTTSLRGGAGGVHEGTPVACRMHWTALRAPHTTLYGYIQRNPPPSASCQVPIHLRFYCVQYRSSWITNISVVLLAWYLHG